MKLMQRAARSGARARRVRTGRLLACVALGVAAAATFASPAAAVGWPNEQEMIESTTGRDTFVADPGRNHLWDRTDLMDAYGSYYRERGFGNVLVWGNEMTIDASGASWAGCGSAGTPVPGVRCPDNQQLHMNLVSAGLTVNQNIRVFGNSSAFIARACGNFSQEHTDEPAPPILTGVKFEDVDGDGARDAGEPGLAGWQIKLFQGTREVTSATTDDDGRYRIVLNANAMLIKSDPFYVREVDQDGWVQSTPHPASVTVPFGIESSGRTFAAGDFGNYRPATIKGVKYEDMAADGDRDADDPLLEGWTIDLDRSGSPRRTDVTDGAGAYLFGGLRPGTYTVAEQLKTGWRYSAPADGSHTITVSSGETASAEFGNYRPATIEGVKFDDHNVNGIRDPGEALLEGWTINLTGGRSAPMTVVTGPDGSYKFDGLIPDEYTVGEVLQAHWRQTAPRPEGMFSFTVRSGETASGDFGNVCLGHVEVQVTDISNGEAVTGLDARIEEISVPGILTNGPPLPWSTTVSGTFADLLPGTYRVIVFLPEGYVTPDPNLLVVDGKLAVVKEITVEECGTTIVPIDVTPTSNGKVTGGMRMDVPGGYATAGFVFMTRQGAPEGSLEYIDHATGLNLHTNDIDTVFVMDRTALITGTVLVDGTLHAFHLKLVDNGEPGTEDRFELVVTTGYITGRNQSIDGGNDQIHPPEHA